MHSYNKLYAIMPRLHMKSHSVCHQSVNNQLKNPKNNKKKYATLWNKSLSIVKNEQFCLYFPNCTICLHCEGDVLLVTHKNYVYSHLCYNVFFFFFYLSCICFRFCSSWFLSSSRRLSSSWRLIKSIKYYYPLIF